MNGYAGEEFNAVKRWISEKIKGGAEWEDVEHLCVKPGSERDEFDRLQNEELIIPPNIDFTEWSPLIRTIQSRYLPITDVYGVDDGKSDNLPAPTRRGNAWQDYKNYLLGKSSGKRKMSDSAVNALENNCHWILNHLKRDTRQAGPIKGLVMGSVQSGKTANMIGLVTMAADYDWNIFIILSGTIDNLRKQTQGRFCEDLSHCGGLTWHILDYSSKPDFMTDTATKEKYLSEDLELDSLQDGKSPDPRLHRYVFVCLKNSKRLRNLIAWLHARKERAARMRILVIDDEADQASVNTLKMGDVQNEDEIERTMVNQLIIDLVRGCDGSGDPSSTPFQAMNYISYTATPYANVLNEAYKESLYPSDFICSLPESDEYFGPKVIMGSKSDEKYPGLDIIRTIPDEETKELKSFHGGQVIALPEELRKSVAWFLCAAAVLRNRGYKKPISMLIHTTSIQNGHFGEYDVLKKWLESGPSTGDIIELCRRVYAEEKDEFRLQDLKTGYPDYAKITDVCDEFPQFDEIAGDINDLLRNIINIEMNDKGQPGYHYHETGIHLCVDNCRANRVAEEGINLRIVYPSSQQSAEMKKAPVFIVMGGNTLSRGLTLEGLVCTYFARNVNQADTLMQMARWFGYRPGYELLQRIWMPKQVRQKFELLEEIDEKLKDEFEDFMRKGKSPSLFGPRIMSSSKIARFTLTSKNKSQNMTPCTVDFTGDSYEVTQFEDSREALRHNLKITEDFLAKAGKACKSEATESAYVWYDVPSEYVLSKFLDEYKIFDCSPLHIDIPIFKSWIKEMNRDGLFLKWNVAVAGDAKSEDRWDIAGVNIGKIERSKKKKFDYVDIGSLRSGRDILSDVRTTGLSDEQILAFEKGKKRGKHLVSLRADLGLSDTPLLLLYRIDKDKGPEGKLRTRLGTSEDIIGFSIIIAGQKSGSDYIKTVQVKIPE